MPHTTITQANSIYQPGTALTLGAGDDLTILTGGYLAGDGMGLALRGDNLLTLWGSVTGGDTAITTTGAANLRLGAGSLVSGRTALWSVGESLTLSADGQIIGNVAARVSDRFDVAIRGDVMGNLTLRADPVANFPQYQTENRLEFGGHLSGDLIMDAPDVKLALAGAELGTLWAKAWSIWLTGPDILAKEVHITTPSTWIGYSSPRVLIMDVWGSRFDVLEVTGQSIDLYLDGASVGILRLRGSVHLSLNGAEVDYLSCIKGGGYFDARGAVKLTHVLLFRGDDRFLGGDCGTMVDDFGGADQIILGAGDDRLTVVWKDQGDDDLFAGGAGWDTLNYSQLDFHERGLHIDLAAGLVTALSPRATRAVGEDRVSGFENIFGSQADDLIEGSDAGEYLWGFWGRDTIKGGAGDDTLVASGAVDLLYGGAGADVFRFHTEVLEKSGLHRVVDFEAGQDRIDLSLLETGGPGWPAGFHHFTQGTGAGTFQLTAEGRWTRVHVDLLSGKALDFLVSGPLTSEDFLL